MFITPEDLAPFADIDPDKAAAMIEDAEAMAVTTAPCLPGLTAPPDGESEADRVVREGKLATVKAVLRAAILRWEDAGSGGAQSEQNTIGPFSQMTTFTQTRRSLFWPSEITQLQEICAGEKSGKAFGIDTLGPGAPVVGDHAIWCSLAFGALYCSCGADLTAGRWPLFYGPGAGDEVD